MICRRCGGDFPHRKGTYCGTCEPPESLADACAGVLITLLAHNHHMIVGGSHEATRLIERLQAAGGHAVPIEEEGRDG